MSWSDEEADHFFQSVQASISDPEVELRGQIWDYGAKVRMKVFWSGGEWEFAKDWSVDALPLPMEVAKIVLQEVRDLRERATFIATCTEAERRAFEFGPWIRRLAESEYGGRLPDAIIHRSTRDRWEQHLVDLSQIRLDHRRAYIAAIHSAGGSSEDLPGTEAW